MQNIILFLVISFVVWIFNLINQNKAKGNVAPRPKRPAGPPRDRRVQNEIDDFLKEIGGGRKVENAQDDDVFIEIVPEEPQRLARPLSQQKPLQPQPVAENPPARQRPGSSIANRKGPGSTNLGGGVREHVADHMRKGVLAEHVEQHLDHDVNESVQQHLGTSRRDRKTQQRVDQVPKKSLEIAKLLYNPSGMRQAILLSEVLSRPKGLRRES